ncbi:MAG: DNA polymerase III subunit gamma/tau [Bacilli bacterium]
MHQVLYRKYRPKTFNDIIGQENIIKIIQNSIKTGRIGHAYIFTGPKGVGKTSLARIFSYTLNCLNSIDNVSCGTCESCKEKDHPDIIEIDAASNNGVDEMRNLRNSVYLAPLIGKYKIYIIDEAHMLTTSAFNAFLKILEEPPKNVKFILATTELDKIIDTIKSRCQIINFNKVTQENIIKNLNSIAKKEKIIISQNALEVISEISNGGIRDSISNFEKVISYKENNIEINDIYDVCGLLSINQKQEFIKLIEKKDISNILKVIENWYETGKDIPIIIDDLIIYISKLIKNIYLDNETQEKDEVIILIKILEDLDLINLKIKKSTNYRILFQIEIIKLLSNINN